MIGSGAVGHVSEKIEQGLFEIGIWGGVSVLFV
jgi:hypothetical protein